MNPEFFDNLNILKYIAPEDWLSQTLPIYSWFRWEIHEYKHSLVHSNRTSPKLQRIFRCFRSRTEKRRCFTRCKSLKTSITTHSRQKLLQQAKENCRWNDIESNLRELGCVKAACHHRCTEAMGVRLKLYKIIYELIAFRCCSDLSMCTEMIYLFYWTRRLGMTTAQWWKWAL